MSCEELKVEIKKGRWGVIIELLFVSVAADGTESVLDISSATIKNINVVKPGGGTLTWAGVFTSNGTDGLLQYTIPDSTVLDELGDWDVEGYVSTPTFGGDTTSDSFTVID